jgi:hypothetical protein
MNRAAQVDRPQLTASALRFPAPNDTRPFIVDTHPGQNQPVLLAAGIEVTAKLGGCIWRAVVWPSKPPGSRTSVSARHSTRH